MNIEFEGFKKNRVPPDQRPERCAGCPYKALNTCGSRGPRDAKIVVVAESPGDLEERYGYPLIGPSGELLSAALPVGTPEILYLNAIQCFIRRSLHEKTATIRVP